MNLFTLMISFLHIILPYVCLPNLLINSNTSGMQCPLFMIQSSLDVYNKVPPYIFFLYWISRNQITVNILSCCTPKYRVLFVFSSQINSWNMIHCTKRPALLHYNSSTPTDYGENLWNHQECLFNNSWSSIKTHLEINNMLYDKSLLL